MGEENLLERRQPPLAFLRNLRVNVFEADEDHLQVVLRDFLTKEHEEVTFVMRSVRRLKVVCALDEGALTQKHISESTGIRPCHLGRVLREMIKRRLVVCRTPHRRKFRTYALSPKGEAVRDFLSALVWKESKELSMTPLERELFEILAGVLNESIKASGFIL